MLRILLVEDNDVFRGVLRATLRPEFPFMEILEAKDGTEAFQCIEAVSPGLIFMDIGLPGESGLTLTSKIKHAFAGIVVIILTSHDSPEYRAAAKRVGADHFMVKGSTTPEEISALVRSFFPNRSDRPGAHETETRCQGGHKKNRDPFHLEG